MNFFEVRVSLMVGLCEVDGEKMLGLEKLSFHWVVDLKITKQGVRLVDISTK